MIKTVQKILSKPYMRYVEDIIYWRHAEIE